MKEKVITVTKENVGEGERTYLNGKASYGRVVETFINNLILCNNIAEVDTELLTNIICGIETEDELYNDRLEELKEENKEGLESETITLEELEEQAREYAEEEFYNYEFYQYFIIDINDYELDYLQNCGQYTLKIMYSELLDVYVLGVTHLGTSWDYVSSDFELKII